ncbi:hypothetical protein M0Q50_10100 [bacterium]|jgi:hypothetical protein|nr:hypothetical protein [bacterium]
MKKFNDFDSKIEEYIKYFNEVYDLDRMLITFNFISSKYDIDYRGYGRSVLFVIRKRFVLGEKYNQFIFFNMKYWNMLVSNYNITIFNKYADLGEFVEINALSKILGIKINDVDY